MGGLHTFGQDRSRTPAAGDRMRNCWTDSNLIWPIKELKSNLAGPPTFKRDRSNGRIKIGLSSKFEILYITIERYINFKNVGGLHSTPLELDETEADWSCAASTVGSAASHPPTLLLDTEVVYSIVEQPPAPVFALSFSFPTLGLEKSPYNCCCDRYEVALIRIHKLLLTSCTHMCRCIFYFSQLAIQLDKDNKKEGQNLRSVPLPGLKWWTERRIMISGSILESKTSRIVYQ